MKISLYAALLVFSGCWLHAIGSKGKAGGNAEVQLKKDKTSLRGNSELEKAGGTYETGYVKANKAASIDASSKGKDITGLTGVGDGNFVALVKGKPASTVTGLKDGNGLASDGNGNFGTNSFQKEGSDTVQRLTIFTKKKKSESGSFRANGCDPLKDAKKCKNFEGTGLGSDVELKPDETGSKQTGTMNAKTKKMKQRDFKYTVDETGNKRKSLQTAEIEEIGGRKLFQYTCKSEQMEDIKITKCEDENGKKDTPEAYVHDGVVYIKKCTSPNKCKRIANGNCKLTKKGGKDDIPEYECQAEQFKDVSAFTEKAEKYIGESCKDEKSPKKDAIEIDNFKVSSEAKQNVAGYERFEFPGCYTVKMDVKLKDVPNVDSDNFAQTAAIGLSFQVLGAGKIQCKHKNTCVTGSTNECYFCDLCYPESRKGTGSDNMDSDFCDNGKLKRKIPLTLQLCPPEGKTEEEACVWANSFANKISGGADVMATVKVYEQHAAKKDTKPKSLFTRRRELYKDEIELAANNALKARLENAASKIAFITDFAKENGAKLKLNAKTSDVLWYKIADKLKKEFGPDGPFGEQLGCAKYTQQFGIKAAGKSTNGIINTAKKGKDFSDRVLKGNLLKSVECSAVTKARDQQIKEDTKNAKKSGGFGNLLGNLLKG